MADLPGGWALWNDEHGDQRILAFRLDVSDESTFPAECMPTVLVRGGSQVNRSGATQIRTKTWHAMLYFELEIEVVVEEFDSREAAVNGTTDITGRFTDGEIDYRSVYRVPREDYFEKLDELTGRES